MGLSAAPKRSAERQARDAFLTGLANELPGLRTRANEALVDAADAGARQRLALRLRTVAADASRVGQVQLAEELGIVRALLQGAGVLGAISDADVGHIAAAFERMASYVEAERQRQPAEVASARAQHGKHPRAQQGVHLRILLCGAPALAESLLAEDWVAEDEAPPLAVDQTLDLGNVRQEAKKKKPALMVVDADLTGARQLCERLLADPDTEAMPLVVIGKWDKAEDAAAYIALGVARTLAKPVSPGALRRACVAAAPTSPRALERIGEVTLDGLGARLADELHRGLCDVAEDRLRKKRVDLGEGGEVLTVMWEAIARIRELVTAQSKGAVRFQPSAIVDALPQAPWMQSSRRRPQHERASSLHEVREGGAPARALDGFSICVAEDDLSTNWFLCGVLREAGADVHGCFDGKKALDHAYRCLPDLVLSDIVMPGLDGYALCRAVKRDVLLRSMPVLLLSWKPDLLQRMRELGAGADGYLLKEASGKEILQRVQELLWPRRTIAERIAAPGAVMGRLDGLSAHALLKLACQLRPMSRLSIKDARFLYEVELRGGRPVLATRTSDDGGTLRGPEVMSALLGIGGGRFALADIDEGTALAVELEGSLDDQLLTPIARVRAAQALLTGPQLLRLSRVQIDEERLGVQLAATPEPARSLLRSLAAGASPRDLIVQGRASAELVERVLCDAGRQGAIVAILNAHGDDALPAAVAREVAIMSGQEAPPDSVPLGADAYVGLVGMEDEPPPFEGDAGLVEPSPIDVLEAHAIDESGPEELPANAHPFARGYTRDADDGPRHTPVIARVVAQVPQFAELDDDEASVDSPAPEPTPAAAKPKKKRRRRAKEESSPPPPMQRPMPEPYPMELMPRVPMPSAWATRSAEPPTPPKAASRWWLPLIFGVVGIGLAVGARWIREHQPVTPPPAPAPPTPVPAPTPTVASEESAPEPQGAAEDFEPPKEDDKEAPGEEPVELPVSKKDKSALKANEGLLEVVVGRNDKVFVDGKLAGTGPVVKAVVAATPEPHEVRVKLRGEERVRYVVVPAGKRMRVRVAPPWSR
jgi:DNA-binding response OmpR family regulator